jgi:RNA polymerase sigma-70 factor (ECF subfamily)
MRFERGNHTLQPTALVHEAYLRPTDRPNSAWRDRTRFLSLAARAMRKILVDHARKGFADKRGGSAIQVSLEDDLAGTEGSAVDVLAVDEALKRLADFDQRQAEILEFHFIAGLTFEEIAIQLNISVRTVKSDWSMAETFV